MIDALFVRPATLADAPRANAILYASLRDYGIAPDRGEVAFTLRKPAFDLVAQIDEDIVGFASMRPDGADRGWISKLFVDAEYRGRGAGKLLLAELVTEARGRGWRRLRLSTRSVFREAIALYESSGWKREPSMAIARGRDRTYFLEL
jgi:ribosomal protein S18 acetylase RimI-like enzyme